MKDLSDFLSARVLIPDEIVGHVYQTTDYSKFNLSRLNRSVMPSDVSHLAESIKNKGQLAPIVVSKDFTVKDGQHRLMACQQLGVPVRYTVDNRITYNFISDVRAMQRGKSWNNEDFLFSNLQREPYKIFNDAKATAFGGTATIGSIYVLFKGKGLTGVKDKTEFNEGALELSPAEKDNFNRRVAIIEPLVEMQEQRWKPILLANKPLVSLIKFIEHPNFSLSRMYSILEESPTHALLRTNNSQDFTVQLEAIYNKYLGYRSRIHLAKK